MQNPRTGASLLKRQAKLHNIRINNNSKESWKLDSADLSLSNHLGTIISEDQLIIYSTCHYDGKVYY